MRSVERPVSRSLLPLPHASAGEGVPIYMASCLEQGNLAIGQEEICAFRGYLHGYQQKGDRSMSLDGIRRLQQETQKVSHLRGLAAVIQAVIGAFFIQNLIPPTDGQMSIYLIKK